MQGCVSNRFGRRCLGNAVAHTLIQDWSHDVMLSARPVQAATKHLHEMLEVVRFTRVVAVEQPLHGQFPRQPPGQGPAPLDLPYSACVGCCAAGEGRRGGIRTCFLKGCLSLADLEMFHSCRVNDLCVSMGRGLTVAVAPARRPVFESAAWRDTLPLLPVAESMSPIWLPTVRGEDVRIREFGPALAGQAVPRRLLGLVSHC